MFSQYSSEALIRRTDIINNSAAGFCSTYGVVDKPPLVSNCYIAGNSGAGVHSQSGTSPIKVFNSVITGNKGGGVYLTDGGAAIIDSCRISNNQVSAGRYGAGIFATRGQIRNCIINNNTNVSPGYFGGGVCMTNAAGNTNMPCGLVNCVIADNYSTNEGGGLALFGESNLVANCIIINNRSSSNIYPDVYNTLSNSNNFWNCCANVAAAPLPPTQGNITNDPMLASGYRPHRNSPCVNAGLNQAWMTNAVDFDCQKRVFYRVVDIGPFERVYSGTVFCFQ